MTSSLKGFKVDNIKIFSEQISIIQIICVSGECVLLTVMMISGYIYPKYTLLVCYVNLFSVFEFILILRFCGKGLDWTQVLKLLETIPKLF